ncbi:MAG: chromosome segregation protein SMC [Clostridiales bacterium]|nr:chromosome segregation protein SMC [Clostridiales bacterium]
MRLKGIKINGFKSFADKISLSFSNGITAIVGPNGSGKSNISDAVRWVLGEQSAKMLRGAKMEDVIFSGTQKRNPMGFAEVTLILDNSDRTFHIEFDEVEVTRKVFLSGESQYMINKSACRLKDIHEIFMDTGLGRDGYSMVGQGKIEEILSSKSDDRRQIFEEAAGISKYRYRKEEAQRKLVRTNENLDRVYDIIAELEGRVEPLKIQSEKAKKYLTFKEELKTYEVNDALRIIEGANDVIGGLDEKLGVVTKQLEEAKNAADNAERTQAEFYQAARDREESAQETSRKTRELSESISIKKGEIDILKNTIAGNETLTERIQNELKEIMEKKEALLTQRSGTEQEAAEKEKTLLQIEEEIDRLTELSVLAEGGAGEQNSEIEELNSFVAVQIERLSELKIALSNQKITRESYLARKETIESEASDRSGERQSIFDKNREIEAEIQRKAAFGEKTEQELEMLREKRQRQENDMTRMRQERSSLTISLSEKRSRRKLLETMEQSFEGYAKSVKTVLREHENGALASAQIYGPVSKLIKVPTKYNTAIEIALGGAVQNIVVKSENDAKRAIACLKSKNAGRATFLPLSSLKYKEPETKLAGEDGFLGMACDLVTCEKQFLPVVKFLLAKTAVIDNIDHAIAISKKFKNTHRLVTLEGELLNVGGSLSGGSFYRQASLMGRENEIKSLAEEIPKLARQIETLEDEEKVLNADIAKTAEEMKKTAETISDNSGGILILERDKSHNELLLNQIDTARRRVEEELQSLDAKIAETVSRQTEIEQEIVEKEQLISKKHDEIQQKESGVAEAIAKKQEISEQITQQNILRSGVAKDLEVISARLSQLAEEISSCETNVALHESEIEDINKKNKSLLLEIEQKQQETEAGAAEVARLDEENIKLQTEKKDFDEKDRALLAEIKALREDVFTLTDEQGRLSQRKVKAETELENTINNLWEEYELTYSDALPYKKELGTPQEVSKEISSLKRKISGLGNVNVDAIEEYKAVSERYEFLSGQRDDLLKAQKDLTGIITDMTKVMRTEFEEKFREIAGYFKGTFTELFGGGTAALTLEDPDNILESGINIDVQPPGKKLQSLSLLSGGERALSAIALLFAILKTRPTPFCFLDEIEAALDDVNVYRFADYIKRYSGNTQFIVVTHRRGTMEAADVIYGVTMQEKGVSKLLTLHLDEIAE